MSLLSWALASVAVWLVAMVVAYNWAVAAFAYIGDPGLCGSDSSACLSNTGFFAVNQPYTTMFGIVVATIVTAVVAEIVVLIRRRTPLGAVDTVAAALVPFGVILTILGGFGVPGRWVESLFIGFGMLALIVSGVAQMLVARRT